MSVSVKYEPNKAPIIVHRVAIVRIAQIVHRSTDRSIYRNNQKKFFFKFFLEFRLDDALT